MTVETTANEVTYVCAGLQVYAFPFRILDRSDLVVTAIPFTGPKVILTIDTDYSINLSEDGTGTVITTLAFTQGQLKLERLISVKQETLWKNGSKFDVEQIEHDLDRLIMLIQQKADAIRAIPTGGAKGTVLVKNSANDFDITWREITSQMRFSDTQTIEDILVELLGSRHLPSGTTADTQLPGNTSSKVATCAFVASYIADGGSGSGEWDGGSADSVYIPTEVIDGGEA